MTKYNYYSRMRRVMALAVARYFAGAAVYLLQMLLFR